MTKSKQIIIVVAALWMGIAASSAQASTTVTDETSLRAALKTISDQKATSDTCGNEACYIITIANSFTITGPVVVPSKTHLVGDGGAQNPVITAEFGTSKYQSGGVPAIFSGDVIAFDHFDIATSITEDAPAKPTEVDAVRLKTHSSVTNVQIIFNAVAAPGVSAKINGFFLTGDNNEVSTSRVALVNGVGLIIAGSNNTITHNKIISTDSYGVLILTKDPGLIQWVGVEGKVAFGFSPDGIIPADQVANILALNSFTDDDAKAKLSLPANITTAKPADPVVPKDSSTPSPTIVPLAPMSSVTPTGGASGCSLIR